MVMNKGSLLHGTGILQEEAKTEFQLALLWSTDTRFMFI
jgi:hypothetical protein